MLGREKLFIVSLFSQRDLDRICEITGVMPQSSLILMRQNEMRHLLNSGHLTGVDKNGAEKLRRLSAVDLCEITIVLKHPDVIRKTYPSRVNGNTRVVFEKQLERNHRLVIELDRDNNRVVTYFNIGNRNGPCGPFPED